MNRIVSFCVLSTKNGIGLRDECLNTNWFINLKHARDVIDFFISTACSINNSSSVGMVHKLSIIIALRG